ncbi:MAG: hypothetical protein MK100_09770, partial [Phycisphaerales bacterium]|nr:hypothetical protein [Phycisphaerales bacterium]
MTGLVAGSFFAHLNSISPEHSLRCEDVAVIDRRTILKQIALLGGLPVCPTIDVVDEFPPVRRLTRAPGHHFFGYYDKFQFDHSGRFALAMRVDFEGRTPRAEDALALGVIDLEREDHWTSFGESTAWGWQQGCMLQWRPAHDRQIMWNDRESDRYVCRILDFQTGEQRTVPSPIYSVAPDGLTAMSLDFRRVQAMRPGYGYVGLPDPHQEKLVPKDSGIFRVNLENGSR